MVKRTGALAFVASAAALLAVLMALPTTSFFSADSGPKYWQCLAFAEPYGSRPGFSYPAASLDPERRFIPPFTVPVADRVASIYPVLFPLVAAAPQAIAGDRAMRLLPWLAALLAAWLTGRLAGALRNEPTSWGTSALALAATPLAFYAIAFWEHSMASAMVLGGLLLVVADGSRLTGSSWRWAGLGTLVGFAAWVRTEVVFLVPLLLAAAALGPRAGAVRCAAGCLVGSLSGLAGGAAVQRLTLGSWLPLHVSYHLRSSFLVQPFLSSRWSSLVHFVAPHWTCGLGVVVWMIALAVVVGRVGSRSRVGQLWAFAAIGASLLAAVVVPAARWLAGARPTDAFPVSAPASTWIVLSALPLLLWGQPRSEVLARGRLLLTATAVWSIVAVLGARQIRSFEWGSRVFLTAVLLLLAVMTSLRPAAGRRRRVRRAIVGVVVGAAMLVQGLGLVLLHHGAVAHQRLHAEISAFTEPGEPIVTDSYMVPLLSGRDWWRRRYLYATSAAGVERIAAACAREGVARWTSATLTSYGSEDRPGEGSVVIGADGSSWTPTQRLERPIGSDRLLLTRYQREWARGPLDPRQGVEPPAIR